MWRMCVAAGFSSIFLFLTFASHVSAQSKWQPFTSKECGFVVNFPGKPETEIGTVRAENKTIDYRSYSYDAGKYTVGVTCNAVAGDNSPDTLLDAARDSALQKLRAKKNKEMRVLVDNHPARLIEITGDSFVGYGELVIANGKYYQVLAIVNSQSDSGIAKRFLKSFRLLRYAKG